MMNFQNPDKQMKYRVKKEYDKAVQNISFSEDSKQLVLSSIKRNLYIRKIINKVNLIAEYEINIPIKAYAVGVLLLCILCGFMVFQNITVSTADISEAKINYITSTSDLGGGNDKN